MSINRTLLAAFHSVASAGSFTTAAQAQNVSQSTLSVHVGRLEKTYGCQLFIRRGRSIELTETGRALFDLTSRQVAAEQDAEALLTGEEGGVSGHLRIGAVSSNAIVGLLKTFLKRFPKSTIALELSNSEQVIRDVADGNLDIGMIGFPITDPRLDKIAVSQENLFLIVGPGHDWVSRDAIDLEELAGQTLILRERGSQTRQVIEDELASRDVRPDRVLQINEWAAVRELVLENLGVAIMPDNEATPLADRCKMRIIGLDMRLTQYLVFRSDRTSVTTLSAFLDLVHRPEGEG